MVRGSATGPAPAGGGVRRAIEATALTSLGVLDLALPLEQDRLATHSVVILPQSAGTGCRHRLSLFSPAGLADGLALKESRFAKHRDSPQAGRPSGSPTPRCRAELRLGWTRPCYQQTAWPGRNKNPETAGCFARPVLLPGNPLDIGRHVLGVLAPEKARWHPALARAAVLDGVQDALTVDAAELVDVGAGDPPGLDGVEVVAALAGGDEELLAVLEPLAGLLGAEGADPALGFPARGDHGRRDGDAERDVDHEDGDRKGAPSAGEIGLAGGAATACERDEEDAYSQHEE